MKYFIPALAALIMIGIALVFGLLVRGLVAIGNLWSDDNADERYD